MKIPVTLNGTKTIFDASPDETLLTVLEKNSITSAKRGCLQGMCGACTVLLNDRPVAACKVSVGLVINSDIVTLDYFTKTEEYTAIADGFTKAGFKLCGYCNAGKIFAAYEILKMNKMPTRKDVYEVVEHLSPCCVDVETLINGVLYAAKSYGKRSQRRTSKRGF